MSVVVPDAIILSHGQLLPEMKRLEPFDIDGVKVYVTLITAPDYCTLYVHPFQTPKSLAQLKMQDPQIIQTGQEFRDMVFANEPMMGKPFRPRYAIISPDRLEDNWIEFGSRFENKTTRLSAILPRIVRDAYTTLRSERITIRVDSCRSIDDEGYQTALVSGGGKTRRKRTKRMKKKSKKYTRK